MKPFLLSVLLLATSLSATAQTSLVASPPTTPQPRTAADTAAAIHRLFAAKRKVCTLLVSGTAVAAATGAAVALSQPDPSHSSGGFGGGIDGRPIMATLIMVASLPVIGVELLTCGGWGHRAEQKALAAAQAHQLPRRLKRTLQPKYFRAVQ